jgi:multidrug efflux pump subunit AcrB
MAQTVHAACRVPTPAWLHDGQSKYPVPVRLQLPREAQVGLDALLALPLRAANGQLVPLSELVRVERGVIDKPLFTKDLQACPTSSATSAGAPGRAGAELVDSPLYGLFAIRGKLPLALPGHGDWASTGSASPADPFRQYA